MEEYKITLRRQLQIGWPFLLFIAVCIVGMYYFRVIRQEENNYAIIIIPGIGIIVQFVLQLALHLDYYHINRKDGFKYDIISKEFDFEHNNEEVRFHLNDIDKIEMFMSIPLQAKRIQMLTFDSYHHAIIHLHNGTIITLTSLMFGARIKIPVDESKIKYKLGPYRWAKGPSLRYDDSIVKIKDDIREL